MSFAERLRILRAEKGLSQVELSNELEISKSSVGMYESGHRKPSLEVLELVADYFNVDLNYLTGKSEVKNSIDFSSVDNIFKIEKKKIPILGNVACGQPTLAVETFEGYIEAGANIHADFCLKAKGDSMINARILNGDIVFIRRQDTVENGEIAAVLIGSEATLKRFYMKDDMIQLIAENPAFPPLVYRKEDLNDIRVLGKAIAFQSDVI